MGYDDSLTRNYTLSKEAFLAMDWLSYAAGDGVSYGDGKYVVLTLGLRAPDATPDQERIVRVVLSQDQATQLQRAVDNAASGVHTIY